MARRRLTQSEFIERSRKKHGDKYNYDKTVYVLATSKVIITCPMHGDFIQRACCHLSGAGCKKCGFIKKGESYRRRVALSKEKNIIINKKSNTAIIPLSQGKQALIDLDDLSRLVKYNWSIKTSDGRQYVHGRVDGKLVKLHRFIMNIYNQSVYVDHINHNPLDNRKNNLRLCSNQENRMNSRKSDGYTSSYKGVHWNRKNKKWKSSIGYNNETIYLGLFDNEADAAKAYDEAAKKYHKEFAYLNFREDN